MLAAKICHAILVALLVRSARGGAAPTIEIAPGVAMPQVAQGLARGCPDPPELVIADLKLGLSVGYTAFDTAAFDPCYNDTAVGEALKDVDRASYFIISKIPSGLNRTIAAEVT